MPLGVVVLPYDILQSVRPLAELDYDIGHFPGLEVPDLLAADIGDFFGKLPAAGRSAFSARHRQPASSWSSAG